MILAAVSMISPGCATHITPPAAVVDPSTVYLVDYGYHAALILRGAESSAGGGDELVEFAFGQYDWYARNLDDWWRAPLVMLIPGQGCLGRRDLTSAVASEAAPTARLLGAQELHAITVERACMQKLLGRLEARWATGSADAMENPNVGMTFVSDADDYWLFHNCNAAVADWLRETGCEVGGLVVGSDWKVAR